MGLLLVILAPVLISFAEAGRDLYCDRLLIRTVTLRGEMDDLRSSLVRRAGRLEHYLESEDSGEGESSDKKLSTVDPAKLLAKLASPDGVREDYWAVVDLEDLIVLHSQASQIGKRLPSTWDDDKQTDVGDDVVRVGQSTLSGEREAYDVHLPLIIDGHQIGSLHSGLDAGAIDHNIAKAQSELLSRRAWFIGLLFVVNAAAIGGVVYLTKRYFEVQSSLQARQAGESRKLTQIGFGLAHEIRNPLHALRLNTHTLRRSLAGKSLSEREMNDMMRESCDEIDRIESLMRALVQFVSPQTSEKPAELELNREAQAILQLQAEEFRLRKIEVSFDEDKALLVVRVIPSQLRAILHELYTFAQRSAGEGGRIQVQLRPMGKCAELVIADQGRQLSPRDLENLFEPFCSTPFSEAGLSLALARQYAIASGGSLVRTQSSEANRFELRLPLFQSTSKGSPL